MLETVVGSVHSLLLDHLPLKTTKTPSGWITMNCPMCSDKRKRGGLNTNGSKISFHCFNCNFTTGWSPSPYLGKKYKELAEKLGADRKAIHDTQIELMKFSDEFEDVDLDNYVYNVAKFEEYELPEGTELIENLSDVNELKQYAVSRGILDLYPSELSGGMQKRVAIARAIVNNPKYLFCDEPNSGLDPKTAIVIDNLIQEITKEYDIVTVINSHDMNSVMEIGEKILFLKDGLKAWEGSKDTIFKTDNEVVTDFVYSSNLFKKVRKMYLEDHD